MEKQELIEKWENKTSAPSCEISASSIRPSEYEMYTAGYGVARGEIIEDLKRLDEPQKVTVPKFVAEWFEKHKHRLGYSIWKLVGESHKSYTTNKLDMRHWILQEPNNPIETLIRMKDGYEVEEEQQWVVMQGGSEVWYLQGFRNSLDGDIVKQWCSYEGCIKFTDRKKAEAVATLVDGSVEEV